MENWIYLKSNNAADALALATVLANGKGYYNIVRRSTIAPYFINHNNAKLSFYNKSRESNLIIIGEIDGDSWEQKCDYLSNILGISIESYLPHDGFNIESKELVTKIDKGEYCLLYLFPHQDQNLNLIIVDQVTRIFERQQMHSISGGTRLLPCIKGTLDFRQILVNIASFISIIKKMRFIITTEKDIATICEAYEKKAFVISQKEDLMLDGIIMQDANQIANYINAEL